MALQRVDQANQQGPLHAAQDASWAAKYPLLVEMLVTTRWPDQKPREVATCLAVAEGGVWKVCLHDRANRRSAWVSGETLDAAFEALETGLQEGSLGWRPSAQGNRR